MVALQGQHYPSELIEVIVIDDGSTDETTRIVEQYASARLIRLNETNAVGKKQALLAGIRSSTSEWILTTDADSIPGPEWIDTINCFLDRYPDTICVVGPVTLTTIDNTPLQAFQHYDHLMFQGITGAAIHSRQHALGNGANLCYQKNAFEKVGGFEGIDQVASGDDVLLIEKFMQTFPGNVRFLKSPKALVKTQPGNSWKQLWQQRLRWVSKTGQYKNFRLLGAQWITGGFNLVLLIQTLLCFVNPAEWKPTLAVWILKAITEWILIRSVAIAYGTRKNFLSFLFLQPAHALYLIAVGMAGRRKTYAWKGRMVR